jgi:nucleoside phosphorylase
MRPQGRAVVLTALGSEYEAVREFLEDVGPAPPHARGTRYETGTVAGAGWDWQVTVGQVGEGIANAAIHCERVIDTFTPHLVLFVGVAGSLRPDSVRLGDVVVATRVVHFQGGKDGDRFRARPRAFESSHHIEQLAMQLRQTAHRDGWLRRLGVMPERPPEVHLKPIASGDVVVDGERSKSRRLLDEHYNDAVAVEMEGVGLLHAAHLNDRVTAGVVRGISDLTLDKRRSDQAGWQERAARHAAAFTVELLAQLDPSSLPDWSSQPGRPAGGERARPAATEGPGQSARRPATTSNRHAGRDYFERSTVIHHYHGASVPPDLDDDAG